MTDEPRYNHDGCDRCVYLGRFGPIEALTPEVDLWFCPQPSVGVPTVMARFGSDGWEYESGINGTSPALVEARRRATEKGLFHAA